MSDWSMLDMMACPCHGSGWAKSLVDTWHKCTIHFNEQEHPDLRQEEGIEVVIVYEPEGVELLEDKLNDARQYVENLSELLTNARAKLADLELELVNSTPTVKVKAADTIDLLDEGWSAPKLEIVEE